MEKKQTRRFLECVDDNFLMQVVRELTRQGTPLGLLDLYFVNRVRIVGDDVMVGSCCGHSNHNMVEFFILGEARRAVSRTATLDFWRADSVWFRTWLTKSSGRRF